MAQCELQRALAAAGNRDHGCLPDGECVQSGGETMKDEYGRTMYSEKLSDMVFNNGKLVRVANQFGNGIAPPAPAPAVSGN